MDGALIRWTYVEKVWGSIPGADDMEVSDKLYNSNGLGPPIMDT